MSLQQDLFNYRFRLGTFYTQIPIASGLPGNGIIAWKAGFPAALAAPYFFWIQESADINLETRVYRLNQKWNLFKIDAGEFGPLVGANIISEACDFLPTVAQNGAAVQYLPETFEIHAAFSALGNAATLAEAPEAPGYIDPPGITYARTEDSVMLFEGSYELV